jgi:photosynthetic reaction center H subunit
MYLLFATLVAIGPLVRRNVRRPPGPAPASSDWPSFPAEPAIAPAHFSSRSEGEPMGTGAITPYIDVAQLVLYASGSSSPALIYYLVRENHREGYPMDTDRGGTIKAGRCPQPKTYKLATAARSVGAQPAPSPQTLNAEPITTGPARRWSPPATRCWPAWAQAPGPTALTSPTWTLHGEPRIVPLRTVPDFRRAHDTDPRGMPVVGADGEVAGTVVDLWVDTSESLFRYLEVETAGGRACAAAGELRAHHAQGRQVKVRAMWPPVRRRAGHAHADQ